MSLLVVVVAIIGVLSKIQADPQTRMEVMLNNSCSWEELQDTEYEPHN